VQAGIGGAGLSFTRGANFSLDNMTLQQLIQFAINASLFALVFALGLRATTSDMLYLVRRPGLLVRSIGSMNIVMLAVALAMVLLFPIPQAVKIALVALAISPVPPILPGKQTKAGGTASYAISLLVTASIAAVLLVPATLELLEPIFHADYQMPMMRVAPIVLISVLIPLVLGLLVSHFAPQAALRWAGLISKLAAVLLVLACLPVIFTSWQAVWKLVGDGVILLLALFTCVGIAVGHLLGGPEEDNRTVLALASGTRHPGVAIAIASLNFPDEKAAAAVILWHLIIGAVVSIPYVRWRKTLLNRNRDQRDESL
jgi:BASS family bile acid:Na+ symporter